MSTAPELNEETPAQEFSRLVIEYNEGEGDSPSRQEAWNLIADFALEHCDTILRALTAPVAVALDPHAMNSLKSHQRQLDMDGTEVGVSRQALDELIAAYEAAPALAALREAPVAVKALEWSDPGLGVLYADTIVGTYKINPDGFWWLADGSMKTAHSVGAAKAAAQQDYETRIRSALASPVPQGEGAPAFERKPVAQHVPERRLESLIGLDSASSSEVHDMAVELICHRRAALAASATDPELTVAEYMSFHTTPLASLAEVPQGEAVAWDRRPDLLDDAEGGIEPTLRYMVYQYYRQSMDVADAKVWAERYIAAFDASPANEAGAVAPVFTGWINPAPDASPVRSPNHSVTMQIPAAYPASHGVVTDAMVEARDCMSRAADIFWQFGQDDEADRLRRSADRCRAALASSLAEVPQGEAVTEALHSCVCLLETLADEAKKRDDIPEWSMMAVMAVNGRSALALAPALADGVDMVLVPKEPTEAMLEAGNKILDFTKLSPEVWAAMLAAAPEQEKSRCKRCNGKGTVRAAEVECSACKGTGRALTDGAGS